MLHARSVRIQGFGGSPKNSEARQRISLVRRGAVRAIRAFNSEYRWRSRSRSAHLVLSGLRIPHSASAGALTLSFTAAGDDHEEDAGGLERSKLKRRRSVRICVFAVLVVCAVQLGEDSHRIGERRR